MKIPMVGLIVAGLLGGFSCTLWAQDHSAAAHPNPSPYVAKETPPSHETPPSLARLALVRWLMLVAPPPNGRMDPLPRIRPQTYPTPRTLSFPNTLGCKECSEEPPNRIYPPYGQGTGQAGPEPASSPHLSSVWPPVCTIPERNGPSGPLATCPSGVYSTPCQPGLLTPVFHLLFHGYYCPGCGPTGYLPASGPACAGPAWPQVEPRPHSRISSSTKHRGYYGDLYLWAIIQPQ